MVQRNKVNDIAGSNQLNPRFRTFHKKKDFFAQTNLSVNQSLHKPMTKEEGKSRLL